MTENSGPLSAKPMTLREAMEKATACHRAGQLEDAERLYRVILQNQPNHPDANHNLGVLAVQGKQPAAGLPYFEAALEANPTEADYWLAYLDALLLAGQTDTAQQVLALGRQQGLQGEEADCLAARLDPYLTAMLPASNEPPPSISPPQAPVPEAG